MKKIFITLFSLITLFSIILIQPTNIMAEDDRVNKVLVVQEGDELKSYYFGVSENVEVRGTMSSDVYVMGEDVKVDGFINGDLIVIGGNVNLLGSVADDVIVIGGELEISGNIGGNLIILAGSSNLLNTSVLNSGIIGASGRTELAGQVSGEVRLLTQELIISNVVGSNIEAYAEDVRLDNEASISGVLNLYSNKDPQIAPQASVAGGVQRHTYDLSVSDETLDSGRRFGQIAGFVSRLIVGLLFLKYLSTLFVKSSNLILEDTWNVLFKGLLVLFIVPVICVALLFTFIGAPLSLMLLAVYLFGLYMSKILVSYLIGVRLFKINNQYLGYFVGLMAIYLITAVPQVAGLVRFIILLVGMGSLWVYFISTTRPTEHVSTSKKRHVSK